MKNKSLIVGIVSVAIVVAICFWVVSIDLSDASQDNSSTPTTSNLAGELAIPDIGNVGGYIIETETIYCAVIVDGEYKYSCFESNNGGRKVEFYASPTEMIIVDINNGIGKYYQTTYEDVDQTYTNPLAHIYNELRDMEFVCIGNDSVNNENCLVFESVQIVQSVDAEQIRYNVYSIEMEWLDGKRYEYKYYEYADGSSLISAEAPDEINPRLNKDTAWTMNFDEMCLVNSETNKKIAFTITNISVGEGLSPDGENSTVEEHQRYVYAYVDPNSGNIVGLKYTQNDTGTTVTIVNEVDIQKPEVTIEMEQMDVDTLQTTMVLIYMLESLI